MKESCALTLARKFKLRTVAKAFEKFGMDLGHTTEKKIRTSFISIAYTKATNIGKAVKVSQDPLKDIEKT